MNRIIVVTGGAAGIGRCTVEYFASKGDRIYFIDNNQEATLALTERMHRKGLNVTGYTGDIAEKQVLEDLARRVLDEQPQGIHCLINNACLMHGGILEGCDYEDFLYIQRVGVAAPYMLAKLFKDHFCGLGIHRQHFLYPGIPVTAQYGKLYGCQRGHHCADPCARCKPAGCSPSQFHCSRLDRYRRLS